MTRKKDRDNRRNRIVARGIDSGRYNRERDGGFFKKEDWDEDKSEGM